MNRRNFLQENKKIINHMEAITLRNNKKIAWGRINEDKTNPEYG